MDRWQRIKAGFKMSFGTTSEIDSEAWWPMNAGMAKTSSGITISDKDALFLGAYFACLRNISEDIAKLPRHVFVKVKGGKERATDHNIYDLVHIEPNEEMTAMNFFETIMHYSIGWKGGYAEIVRNGSGYPSSLSLIHPTRVTPKRNDNKKLFFEINVDDLTQVKKPVILEQKNIINIHGLGPNGTHAYALHYLAKENIALSIQLQKYAAKFFANDASSGIALIYPGTAKPEVSEKIRALWNLEYAGSEMAHKIKVLGDDIKITSFTQSPQEAQSIETQQHMIEVMSSWFRMPPHKIQHLLRATYSNIETQNIEYLTDTLLAWLVRIEQELTRKLLTKEERQAGYFIEHIVEGLLRADSVRKIQYYRGMVMMGAMTLDEVRTRENLNEIKDDYGKIHWVPLNMISIDKAAVANPSQKSLPSGMGDIDTDREDKKQDANIDQASDIFRPLFIEALARIFNKETMAVKNALKKYKGKADEFNQWLIGFMDGQKDYYIQEMTSPARVYASSIGASDFDVDSEIILRAELFIEQAMNEINFKSDEILELRGTHGLETEADELMAEIKKWETAI